MKLSFIILNYKTPHHLRLCLERLTQYTFPFPSEIIVVDNASGDTSLHMVESRFPTVRCVANKQNIGHPGGINRGLSKAHGEYIAILNPDIIVRKQHDIENIINYMEHHERVGFIGPQLHNPDGSIQYSCYRHYSLLTPLYRRTPLGQLPFAKRDIARHLMIDISHQQTMEVEWLLGAFLIVRRETIQNIGPMNEKFFLYFADYEWCDRARRNGWKVIYFHETNDIIHYHQRASAQTRHSIRQLFSYVTRMHIRDWITYLRLQREPS